MRCWHIKLVLSSCRRGQAVQAPIGLPQTTDLTQRNCQHGYITPHTSTYIWIISLEEQSFHPVIVWLLISYRVDCHKIPDTMESTKYNPLTVLSLLLFSPVSGDCVFCLPINNRSMSTSSQQKKSKTFGRNYKQLRPHRKYRKKRRKSWSII